MMIRRTALILSAMLAAVPACAVETSFSGFGTIGYSRSNQPDLLQRYVDEDGTFKRDTLLGVQMDMRFNAELGATVQAKLAPATDDDGKWEATLPWVFLSWRPDNEVLLRAGKIRLPYMLNAENLEVGATFDIAHLPYEVYSILPSPDIYGLSASRTWLRDHQEWSLEGYVGRRDYTARDWDNTTPVAKPVFIPFEVESAGLALSIRDDENLYRVAFHRGKAGREDAPMPATLAYVPIVPGIGYYDPSMAPLLDESSFTGFSVGADVSLPDNFRLIGEYTRLKLPDGDLGLDRWGAYVALLKHVGRWTPYVYYAATKSRDEVLDLYKTVRDNRVPDGLLDPLSTAMINASQPVVADMLGPIDQRSWAVGTSYRWSPSSLLKFEWSRTQTGIASATLDPPPGRDSENRQVDSFTLSYSFVF